MDWLIVAIVTGCVVAMWVAAASAVISAARTPSERWRGTGRTLRMTIMFIVVSGGFGGLYYWWRIRPELRALAARRSIER